MLVLPRIELAQRGYAQATMPTAARTHATLSTPPDIFAFDARQNFQNATSRWIERSGSITQECKDVISVICHLFWNQRPVHGTRDTDSDQYVATNT